MVLIKRIFIVFLLLIFLMGGSRLVAENPDPFPYPVTIYTLQNGMTVILSEDYSLPVVSVVVAYKVGSLHDQPRRYGLAYILENLMFQGSRNIGRMQHVNFISRVGGEFNAVTSFDRTIFHQTLPSNQLPLVLWLESDRMYSLIITPPKVDLAKRMIRTDIQRRTELDPYLESALQFDRMLYSDADYSHPIFGVESHLPNISTQDVWDFYRMYYTPSNAILCITGHFEKEKVIQLIERYFSADQKTELKIRSSLPFILPDSEIVQNEESSVPSPCFFLGYRLVNLFPTDHFALKFIEYSLLRGKGSRLYKRLISRERLASRLDGGFEKRGDKNTFKLFITTNSEQLRERCRRILFTEINRLRTGLMPETEYRRAANMVKMNLLNQYVSLPNRALFLVESLLDQMNMGKISDEIKRALDIPRSNIMGVAARHFSQNRIRLDVQVR